jgi:hypothetical protein
VRLRGHQHATSRTDSVAAVRSWSNCSRLATEWQAGLLSAVGWDDACLAPLLMVLQGTVEDDPVARLPLRLASGGFISALPDSNRGLPAWRSPERELFRLPRN